MKEKDEQKLEEIQDKGGINNASQAERPNKDRSSHALRFPWPLLTMPVIPWGARRSMPPAEEAAFLRTA
jgi:hypothetical protein